MHNLLKSTVVAATFAVSFAAMANAATIVQNGSFEQDPGIVGLNGNNFADLATPGGANWDIFTTLPGWTVESGDGVELQTAETIPLMPYDGNYYAELDGNQNTSISQDITLGLGRYLLSFAYSPRINQIGTNAISFGVLGLVSDTVEGPSATYPIGQWTMVTAEFTVTAAGQYTLFFDAASRSDSFGGFVDNIQVAAVPVPAAGFLLFGALGGLAMLRRRKTA